ncbi:MAG TPA: phage antirepressor protein, partial [Patescibacteria group bacterium]|nr:phage antirepressor protein [Patescibacteria group bacterium]
MKKQSKKKAIIIFEGNQIRRHWDEKKELWYFSVTDVIAILTNSIDPLAYWRKLKERLLKEGGNQTVTKCHGLRMIAQDG